MPSHAVAHQPVHRTVAHGAGRASDDPTGVLALQRLAGNRAVASLLQREPETGPPGAEPPPKEPERVTAYLGLNPKAGKEAKQLEKSSKSRVLVSLNDPVAEAKFKEPGTSAAFDFVIDELGFDLADVKRWDLATDVLLNADPNVREQLAQVMRWFNQAEKGEITLERIVLSGHSNGVELWGEARADDTSKPGKLLMQRDLQALVDTFPKAAAQVQDIMFSACFSINAVLIVTDLFPNLQTCWSYKGFSPDVKQGSGKHIEKWARATEGEGTLHKRDKQGNSALWTRADGFVVGDPAAAAVGPLFTEVARGWADVVLPMVRGDRDADKAVLDPIYIKLQDVAAHPGADSGMRATINEAMPVVLRLRFWATHVRERFGQEYAAELGPAYQALGLQQPSWAGLTRPALKKHLGELDKAYEAHPDQAAAKATLQKLVRRGLYRLESDVIKTDWI